MSKGCLGLSSFHYYSRAIAAVVLTVLVASLAALPGCAPQPDHGATGGLSIAQMNTAIGGISPDEQKLSYSITLVNGSVNEVSIKTLQPVLSDQFAKRASVGSAGVDVNTGIKPLESLTVSGDIAFDTKGVSKQEIANWGQAIIGAKILSEVDLKSPWIK